MMESSGFYRVHHLSHSRVARRRASCGSVEAFNCSPGRSRPRRSAGCQVDAQTDIVHSTKINDVIAASELTPDEWRWMNSTAETAGRYKRGMYDHEAFA